MALPDEMNVMNDKTNVFMHAFMLKVAPVHSSLYVQSYHLKRAYANIYRRVTFASRRLSIFCHIKSLLLYFPPFQNPKYLPPFVQDRHGLHLLFSVE